MCSSPARQKTYTPAGDHSGSVVTSDRVNRVLTAICCFIVLTAHMCHLCVGCDCLLLNCIIWQVDTNSFSWVLLACGWDTMHKGLMSSIILESLNTVLIMLSNVRISFRNKVGRNILKFLQNFGLYFYSCNFLQILLRQLKWAKVGHSCYKRQACTALITLTRPSKTDLYQVVYVAILFLRSRVTADVLAKGLWIDKYHIWELVRGVMLLNLCASK